MEAYRGENFTLALGNDLEAKTKLNQLSFQQQEIQRSKRAATYRMKPVHVESDIPYVALTPAQPLTEIRQSPISGTRNTDEKP